MRAIPLAALGLAAYAVFLVATMPASFVAARAEAASRGALSVHDARGTAWQGAARATVQGPAGAIALERVVWRLRPARLLQGRLAFDVQAAMPSLEARFEASRSPSVWEVHGLQGGGAASALALLAPVAAAWRPQGELAFSADRLSWNGESFAGEARLEWRDAAVALSEVRPLGSYALDVIGEGPRMALRLRTLQGTLRLAGQGSLTAGGRFELMGEARGDGAQARALEPLLALLGPRRADGAHALRLRLD